jgi:hypothetical protein
VVVILKISISVAVVIAAELVTPFEIAAAVAIVSLGSKAVPQTDAAIVVN